MLGRPASTVSRDLRRITGDDGGYKSQFVTLEDETGSVDTIFWPTSASASARRSCVGACWPVAGPWQAKVGSTHLIARRLIEMTPWQGELATRSRQLH